MSAEVVEGSLPKGDPSCALSDLTKKHYRSGYQKSITQSVMNQCNA